MLPRLFFDHFTSTSFVAVQDGRMIGFLVGFLSPANPREAYIHFVGVFEVARAGGCSVVRAVTAPVNRGSITFHRHMGLAIEPSETEANGVPIAVDYDGPGRDRVLFVQHLRP